MKCIFVAEFAKNTGQTTVKGGEGASSKVGERQKLIKCYHLTEDDDG